MNEQTIQFPALTIAEANLVLEGLKQLPFGYVNDLFHKLRNEAVRQEQDHAERMAVEEMTDPKYRNRAPA